MFEKSIVSSNVIGCMTRVVVVTAKDLDQDDRAKLQGGVEDIVSKTGTSVDDILAEVREALHNNIILDGD